MSFKSETPDLGGTRSPSGHDPSRSYHRPRPLPCHLGSWFGPLLLTDTLRLNPKSCDEESGRRGMKDEFNGIRRYLSTDDYPRRTKTGK